MNLSRSLSRFLSSSSSSSNPKKWKALQFSSFRTETPPSPSKRAYKRNPNPSASQFPRPSDIPFQAKVANSVHLVGTIGVPVQLQTLPEHGAYAVSVLVQEKKKDLPQLCIPIIFQGDLAQIAACHLNERDLVYVTGQLSGDALPLTIEDKSQKTVEDAQSRIQVLAHSLNFVQNTFSVEESHVDQDDLSSDGSVKNPSDLHLWSDLLANPHKWWDNRSSKSNPAHAAFKQKDSGELLWINNSTPKWILSKLDMTFGQKPSKKSDESGGVNKANNSTESLWTDLVDNPEQWSDKRGVKLNGMVNPKYPDFKQNNTGNGLWLDSAPAWVLPKLDGLVFYGSNNITIQQKPKQQKDDDAVLAKKVEKENLWKNLVENPNKWWDNRSSKLKPNQPDFKHKNTGDALWLGSSTPAWVLLKFPPLDTK